MRSSTANSACRRTENQISAYADGALANAERREVAVHLRECERCARSYDQLARTRLMVKSLPGKVPPAHLTASLHLLARRELSARTSAQKRRYAIDFAWSAWKLRLENLMRPLAIPFAGGLVSALVLFSMLVPSYPVIARATENDVPTAFYQEPTLKSWSPFGISNDLVVVDVCLDEQGQVIDYSLPLEAPTPALRSQIENTLLFARFNPALSFGQPTLGKIRLTFRRSQIDVKG